MTMPPDPTPLEDDVLTAHAAGETDADVARAVEARAALDPAVAARLAAARELEARLRAEALDPLPLSLVAAVLDRLRLEPRAPWEREPTAALRLPGWARTAAAAALVAVGGWVTLAGIEPVAAAADTVAASGLAVPLPPPATATMPAQAWGRAAGLDPRRAATSLADRAADLPGGPTGLLVAGAAVLGVAGLAGRRWSRAGASR